MKAGSVGPALDRASDEARALLRSRRHDAPGAEDSFELSTNETFVGPLSVGIRDVWSPPQVA